MVPRGARAVGPCAQGEKRMSERATRAPGDAGGAAPERRTLLALALFGALAATAGDFGQLWQANAGRPALGLAPPPPWTISVATLAGALGLPLYALGYLARAREAGGRAPGRARVVMIAGCAFAAVGGSVHATTGVLIWGRVGEIAGGLDPLQGILASGPIVSTLWAIGSALFLVAAGAEALLPQPTRERMEGPLFLTLAITALAQTLSMPWPDFVGPASINLAHAGFFAAGLVRASRSPVARGPTRARVSR